MSKPKYKWWNYVILCCRDYFSADPTDRESRAVYSARQILTEEEQMYLYKVFSKRMKILDAAKTMCLDEQTAKRIYKRFIYIVARNLDLL